jgi:catechol 2,3-dioxygenase-like lactoylglutathione lyase family enzyme
MAILPDMIGLVVRDMSASLKFYRTLGLLIPDGKDAEPYVDVTTSNGYRISWNSAEMVKQIDPTWTEPSGGARMELAFKCDSPAHVDATYDKLTRAGYHGHKQPWDAFWGQRYAIVNDPDGNHISLFAPLG